LNEFRHFLALTLGIQPEYLIGKVKSQHSHPSDSFPSLSSTIPSDTSAVREDYHSTSELPGSAASHGFGLDPATASVTSFDRVSRISPLTLSEPSLPTNASLDVGIHGHHSSSLTANTLDDNVSAGFELSDGHDDVSSLSIFQTSREQPNELNSPNIYQDSNPEIIRRATQEKNIVYTQNVHLRFLQPPRAPSPGVNDNMVYRSIRLWHFLFLAAHHQRSAATSATATTATTYSATGSIASATASTYFT
jgi:hypothetical protein